METPGSSSPPVSSSREQILNAPRTPIPKTGTAKDRIARKLRGKEGRRHLRQSDGNDGAGVRQLHILQDKHVLLRGLEQDKHE